MQYLRLLFLTTLFCGALQTAHAAALFGGPKTLPDDGTYENSSGDTAFVGSPNHRTSFIAPVNGTCQVSCNSSQGAIQVDVRKRCMCISGSKCFTIDVGHGGPGSETTNGLGVMSANVAGARYQTKPGPGTTSYDNDAVNMGISANSKHGKWIHKSRRCGANGNSTMGGRNNTAGCIAVPCAYWPEVKGLARQGQTVQVCNGVPYETSRTCGGRCGASSTRQKGQPKKGRN